MKRGFRAQLQAFFSEFPLAKKYVGDIKWLTEKPTVQRIDLDLLDKFPWTLRWARAQSLKAITLGSQRYFLVDKSGNEITEVKRFDVEKFKLFRFCKEIVGETIAEAIDRLDDPDNIRYILDVRDYFGRENGQANYAKDFTSGLIITVHKVPTGRTFSKWMKEIPLVAKEQLQKELAEVDHF